MSTVFHWSDALRERPTFFEVPGKAPTYVPPKPQLPAILVGPGTAASLAEKSAPIAEQIVERGLGFDSSKLQAILDEAGAEIERLNAKLPRSADKSGRGLLEAYGRGMHDNPYGGYPIDHEAGLWRAFPYCRIDEISAVMQRLRWRRLAAFCTNVLAALDESGRVYFPVFANALNGVLPGAGFDPRELTFGALLPTLKGPALVIHTPELPLRAIAFAVGDTTLTALLGESDPWTAIYARVHPEATLTSPEYQRIESRELVTGHIFGNGLGSTNEMFGRLYLPHRDTSVGRLPTGAELYESWIGSLTGWCAWCAAINQATADGRMQYQSYYSNPNPQKAGQQRARLLRENTLAAQRVVGLSINETLENWSASTHSSEPRGGRGRQPKGEAAHLVGALGDYFVIESDPGIADELGEAIEKNLVALFEKHFPGFKLLTEIKKL